MLGAARHAFRVFRCYRAELQMPTNKAEWHTAAVACSFITTRCHRALPERRAFNNTHISAEHIRGGARFRRWPKSRQRHDDDAGGAKMI